MLQAVSVSRKVVAPDSSFEEAVRPDFNFEVGPVDNLHGPLYVRQFGLYQDNLQETF